MMTPKVVKFTQNKGFLGLYSCRHPDDVQGDYLLPGDQSGEYVPLVEYEYLENEKKLLKAENNSLYIALAAERDPEGYGLAADNAKLRRLVERLVEIGSQLFNIFDGNAHWKSTELEQLLADCRKALE